MKRCVYSSYSSCRWSIERLDFLLLLVEMTRKLTPLHSEGRSTICMRQNTDKCRSTPGRKWTVYESKILGFDNCSTAATQGRVGDFVLRDRTIHPGVAIRYTEGCDPLSIKRPVGPTFWGKRSRSTPRCGTQHPLLVRSSWGEPCGRK